MRRRRYVWRHPFHHLYILDRNPAVKLEADRGRYGATKWVLKISGETIGEFRTFTLAEASIPVEALRA